MPLAARITDDDVAPFPKTFTHNLDGTINTIDVIVTNFGGSQDLYVKTLGYSGGLLVSESIWVKQ